MVEIQLENPHESTDHISPSNIHALGQLNTVDLISLCPKFQT